MKYILITLSFVFFVSCKSEEKNKIPKQHNPYQEISQNIENERAIELYFKGTDNLRMGNFELASDYLKKSFEIEKSPITLNELGTVSFAQKNYNDALKYYSESIILDKSYYPGHINKSKILAIQSDFENAERTLKEMIVECDSEYWIAYANLYLATIYFNDRKECELIEKHLDKAKILKQDLDLVKQYLSIEEKIKKNCG
jgi:tetratricopeptide (TPR) repeat protein